MFLIGEYDVVLRYLIFSRYVTGAVKTVNGILLLQAAVCLKKHGHYQCHFCMMKENSASVKLSFIKGLSGMCGINKQLIPTYILIVLHASNTCELTRIICCT